jgi:mannose/fructose/N-acetylgalactosamine-specific phosphotransferase system component IID
LYWVLTDGFSAGPSSTMRARVVGTGAVLGLAAAIVGGSIVARNMKKVVALMTQASGVSDGAARSTLMAQAAQIRQKVATGGRLVAILLFVTTILMVVGAHFV